MREVRAGLEEALMLCDDSSWSHAARMLKIKGLISQALNDLNNAPLGDRRGGEARNAVQKPDKTVIRTATTQHVDKSPASGEGR